MARALSLFYGAFNGGVVAGGFLGGLVASRLGLAAPLFFLAGIAGVLAIVMMRVLREPVRTIPAPAESVGTLLAKPASVLTLLRIPGFAAAVIAALANLWVFGAVFNTLVPLFARDRLHLSTLGIGILYAISLAVQGLPSYPAGHRAGTRGRPGDALVRARPAGATQRAARGILRMCSAIAGSQARPGPAPRLRQRFCPRRWSTPSDPSPGHRARGVPTARP